MLLVSTKVSMSYLAQEYLHFSRKVIETELQFNPRILDGSKVVKDILGERPLSNL